MKTKQKQNNTAYGVTGVVLTVLSGLLFLMPYFGLPLAIAGIVFGCKHDGGLKVTSIILGTLSIIVNSVMLFVVGAVLALGMI